MDGEMIGFAGGDLRPSEGTGWVATLAVLPQYRRQGVGTALLRACENADQPIRCSAECSPLQRCGGCAVPPRGLSPGGSVAELLQRRRGCDGDGKEAAGINPPLRVY